MADEKDRKRKLPKALNTITSGKQARERAAHNKARYQPGEIRTAESPEPDQTRLDRALARSAAADLAERDAQRKGAGQAGEVRVATSEISDEQREKERVQKFLRLALERFKLSAEVEGRARREMLDDLEFRVGQQWPKDIETQRNLDGRPCLTMNRLPQFIRQITNEQRQQRPSIQVNPVGDGADQKTAEILQGICRHIEVNSDAEVGYDTAFDHCVTTGLGWLRILTDYVNDRSFDQEIYIKPVRNPFSVYDDPSAVEPDRSDANWRFIVEDVPREEYRQRYPDSQAASFSELTSVGDNAAEWANKETIRVAEYFYVEEMEYSLHRLEDGSLTEDLPEGAVPQETQKRTRRTIRWSKINAVEIIEGHEPNSEEMGRKLPGKFIPLVPVLADDLEVNGRRHIAGLVRNAKDPQRMYNYWVSAATEMIALAPRAPFVGVEGQFENHEEQWRQANTRNFAFLEYKAVDVSGKPAPPPARQVYEPPVQSINLMTQQADLDLKTTTGIYDPSLGQNKRDQSGKAINLLQKQSDVSTLNFVDNLSRSIRHVGRILLDYIPAYYPKAKVQRIIKPDQSVTHVVIANGDPQQAQQLADQQNINKIYDLSQGEYDITISVGPSYQSKRQEAVAAQLAAVQAYPPLMQLAGDLIVRNMDWPGHNEIADRLKKMLPPQILQGDQDMDPEQQIALLQAQLQQLGQQHAMSMEIIQKQTQMIQEKQVEANNKLQIEQIKSDTQLAIAQVNTKAQDMNQRMDALLQVFRDFHESAHDIGMQAHQQAHEKDMANLEAQLQPEQPQNGNGANG